jgi:hypothetical protein
VLGEDILEKERRVIGIVAEIKQLLAEARR